MPQILLIEDDEASRLLVKEIIESTGVSVIESARGDKGLMLFKENLKKVRLILMDIRLPDCEGWDLVKHMKSVKPSIPVIAISAMIPSELANRYKGAGFDNYMLKPLKARELLMLINYYL